MSEITTKEPVTVSGYYLCTDDLFHFVSWVDNQPKIQEKGYKDARLPRVAEAVEALGHLAYPYYLKELGFSQGAIEAAVREGLIRWTSDGGLRTV